MFVYGGEKPKVYGPRWARLEDAPEKIRHLLVEVDEVRESVLNHLPEGVEIEVRVWKHQFRTYKQAATTKETFWETVQDLANQIISEDAGPALLSKVWIMKIKGDGWCWDFGMDGLSTDKKDYPFFKNHMLSLDDEEDIELAARVMTLFSNIQAYMR